MIDQNQILNVFPLSRKPITNDLLLSKCSDPDRDIKYYIKSNPTMGKIIMETSEGIWLEVDRFTQKDLNNSKVSYEHNKQFNNLSASDNFTFDIETPFAQPLRNLVITFFSIKEMKKNYLKIYINIFVFRYSKLTYRYQVEVYIITLQLLPFTSKKVAFLQ